MPSSDATLSALTTTAGSLTFSPTTLSYTVNMPYTSYETPTRTVTPTVTATGLATVKVNAVSVTSGSPCAATFINVGSTVFTIIVTAEDATTKTYTLTVVRAAASTVSTLSSIGISSGQLTPTFSPTIYDYTVSVVTEINSVKVIPTVTQAATVINVNGIDVVSGAASNNIMLSIGTNIIVLTCTAEDDITLSTYTITVTRADFSDEAELINKKSVTIGSKITDTAVLKDFAVQELAMVGQIQSLSDCAKNLPHRLMEMGLKKAEDLILNNPLAKDLIAQLDALNKQYENIKRISEMANPKKLKELSLNEALLALKGLTGLDLVAKTNEILNNFGQVTGISDILNGLSSLDICASPNYGPDGALLPNATKIPLDTPPPSVEGVASPVANMSYDSKPKDEYDAFIFQLKEHLNKDPQKVAALSGIDLENYIRMLSVLNTLAYAYHDNISRTTDDAKDAEYKATYLKLVQDELSKHPEWNGDLKVDYNGRSGVIENEITRNTAVIRAYYARNAAATGDWIPFFMTAYGNASIDPTTAREITPPGAKLKPSDQFNGAYGVPLVQGTSVASNYFKGKTILEIRYAKDKTPVGSGRVTVHDTGGMSNNVIDYYCGDDKAAYKSIEAQGVNTGGKTKPADAAPIEVRIVSGGIREGRTI